MDKGTVLDALAATPREHQLAKLAEIRHKSIEKAKSAPRATDAHPVESRSVTGIGLSAAAVWIVAQLGPAKAAHFSNMLAEETPGTFIAQLRTITGLSDRLGPADDASGHVPGGTVSSDSFDPICSTAGYGVGVMLVPDAQAPATGPVIFSEPASGSGEAATPLQQNRRRLSNWLDVADVPEDGDWCQECNGTKWWRSLPERPGWRCAGCFEPQRHRL